MPVDPANGDRSLLGVASRLPVRAVLRRPRGLENSPLQYPEGYKLLARRKLSGSLLEIDTLEVPEELRNHDRSASARETNVNEFAAHKYTDKGHYSGQPTEVNLGADKTFAIRGEKATSQEGQVDIHYNYSNMTINGRQTSLIDFCRQSALGVVEFDLQGKVLHVRMF